MDRVNEIMNSKVSIITPVIPFIENVENLLRLYFVLNNSRVHFEWLIGVEMPPAGSDTELLCSLPVDLVNDPRVRVFYVDHNIGVDSMRNLCLSKATGDYVTSINSHDFIPNDSLQKRLDCLKARDCEWVAGIIANSKVVKGKHVMMDSCEQSLGLGEIPVHGVFRAWDSPSDVFPFEPITIMTKTSKLLSIGGWMSLPSTGELGMSIGLSAKFKGFMMDKIVYYKTKHTNEELVKNDEALNLEKDCLRTVYRRGKVLKNEYDINQHVLNKNKSESIISKRLK